MYDRDFEYDYFGFKTLERSYLMRCDGDIAERPQHMIMRVAIGIHGQDVRSRRPRIAKQRPPVISRGDEHIETPRDA